MFLGCIRVSGRDLPSRTRQLTRSAADGRTCAVAPARPPAARLAALIVAMFALGVALPAGTASAAPPTGLRAAAPDSDEEGGTPALRAQLEAASKGYLDAKRALDTSVQRQQQLATQLKTIEVEIDQRNGKVGEIAEVAYRTGRLGAMSALLNSSTPEGFMDRAAALDAVAANEDRVLRDLLKSKDQANRTRVALDSEILEQRKQVTVMAKRKEQAERALAVATTPKTRTTADTTPTGAPPPPTRRRRHATPTAPGRRSRAASTTPRRPAAASPRAPCTRSTRPRPQASPGTSRATAPAAPVNTRRAGPATSPRRRAASAAPPPAATRPTATTWPRTSSATRTGSPCST